MQRNLASVLQLSVRCVPLTKQLKPSSSFVSHKLSFGGLQNRSFFSFSSGTTFHHDRNFSTENEKVFDTYTLFDYYSLHGTTEYHEFVKKNISKYKTDPQVLARWLDMSVTHRQGKAFSYVMKDVIPKKQAIPFPSVDCYRLDTLLNGSTNLSMLPDSFSSVDANASVPSPKVVIFSFKNYGFSLLRGWLDEFLHSSEPSLATPVYEICFIEYSFLSMAKGFFAKNIRNQILPSQYENTFLKFGGIQASVLSISFRFLYFSILLFLFHRNLLGLC
jgi:hypothetical protein